MAQLEKDTFGIADQAGFSRAVQDAVIDGIISINSRGRICSVNKAACRLFGYSEQELIGQNVNILMPSPYKDEHDGYLSAFLKTRTKKIIGIGREVAGRKKNGAEFPMSLAVDEFIVSGSSYFVGIVRDISALKQAEIEQARLIRELENKNAELERFTYTVSHDLKSPLITIRGFLGALKKDIAKGALDRVDSDIDRIESATATMQTLLSDLLELSRIAKLTSPSEVIDTERLISDVLHLLKGPIEERGVSVDAQVGLPKIYGDRARVMEVFVNLIDNAVKFIGEESEPFIEIGFDPQKAAFYVSDNGIGINKDYYDRIFLLFDRLNSGTVGTGIGLAIVKRTIEGHGGKIWPEPSGHGTGTIFYFSLPLSSDEGKKQYDQHE